MKHWNVNKLLLRLLSLILFMCVLLPGPVSAQMSWVYPRVEEADGDPNGILTKFIFPNYSLSQNGTIWTVDMSDVSGWDYSVAADLISPADSNRDVTLGTGNVLTLGNLTASKPVFSNSSKTLVSTGTVPVDQGGTGQTTYTNGQLLIGNTTGNTLMKATLTGTSNQVTVTNGTGTITLSTPQDIHTTASPQFTGATLTGNMNAATYGSDSSITDAELRTLDDGATTDVFVGGGAGSAPVWTTATGTGAPARAGSPTFTTQITTPIVYGSSAANGDLILTGTSNATKTTSNVVLQSTGGNVQIGTTTEAGTSGQNVIVLGPGVAPTTSPADVFQLWQEDYNGAGSVRLYGRTEEGNSQPIALLTESQIAYGVAWNETTDAYTRLGRTTGHKVGATLPAGMLPIQTAMKRCLLSDAGVVNYSLSPSNSALKVDGATASVLTGADGQVMVRIPKFWYRYNYISPVHYWEISPVALSDFEAHPAFYKDGAWVDFRYYGAYKGVLYDTSITTYVDGMYQPTIAVIFATADDSITATAITAPFKYLTVGQKIVVSGTVSNDATLTVASLVSDTVITVSENLVDETDGSCIITTQKDTTATTGDKLSSVSGKRPINYLTRAQMRVLAANRGSGWRQLDYDLVSAVQLLFLTEYASFYSQSMIGAGITNVTDWVAYNNQNPIARSGNSNAIGNVTGNTAGSTACADEVTDYLSYRGIENWFGHIWEWTDGLNVNGNIPYITNNSTNWADDTATNYTRPTDVLGTSITLHNANGYVSTLEQISRGFLAASIGGSSSTKITDYYYQNTGWRVAALGSDAGSGAAAGGFSWYLNDDSAYLGRNIGGRIAF